MFGSAISHSPDDLFPIAQQLINAADPGKIIVFRGPLGAGKTTLIKNLCAALGVNEYTGSPTFSIVNEYQITDHNRISHFDLYRIKDEIELLDIGWDEYLDSGNWVFIEWPEKAQNLLPEHFLSVLINVEDSTRQIDWKIV